MDDFIFHIVDSSPVELVRHYADDDAVLFNTAEPYDVCDKCRFATYKVHCKLQCRNCGARRDCSDL